MRFLTLNIGASRATLAEYNLAGKRDLTLVTYGSAALAQVSTDAASSLDMILTPAILQIMQERGIKPGPVIISLGSQTVFPRYAKLPAASDEKFAELVGYEVQQNVPFPIDEIVYDFQRTGELDDGDVGAMILAAKLTDVRAATDAVKAAGLTPIMVDSAPMAVHNALAACVPALDGCNVILDIGSRTTSLIIVEGARIYNRSIPVAGNAITKELMNAFGCTQEEAEQLKLERGYVSLGGVTEDEDELSDRVSKVVRTVFTRLHAEISRSINFYRSQQGGGAPTRLFLTGGTTRMAQLDEFFRESLRVDVAYINPLEQLKLGSKVNQQEVSNDAFTLAESFGLALRQTDRAVMHLNLTPPEILKAARDKKRIPFVVAGAAMILAALGAGIFCEMNRTAVIGAEKEAVEAQVSKLQGLEKQLQEAQKKADEAMATSVEFQKLAWARSKALQRVKAVREALLPGMWLVEWSEQKAKAAEQETSGGRRKKAPAAEPVESAKLVVRGWSDVMRKAEADYSAANGGKRLTAAEIVQDALKRKAAIVPESVKIVAQKESKGVLTEFALSVDFTMAPAVVAAKEAK